MEGQFEEFLKKVEKAEQEISSSNSTKEKLDFWENTIFKDFEDQLDEYHKVNQEDPIITPLKIPKSILEKYIDVEDWGFRKWFIQYNGNRYFELMLDDPSLGIKVKIESSNRDSFIAAELKKIDEFRDHCENLWITGQIQDGSYGNFNAPTVTEYSDEIEFLRLKWDYYKSHSLKSISGYDSISKVYAKYFLYQEWLTSHHKNDSGKTLSTNDEKDDPFEKLNTFKDSFTNRDFESLKDLISLMMADKIPENFQPIKPTGHLNAKKFARALYEIYRSKKGILVGGEKNPFVEFVKNLVTIYSQNSLKTVHNYLTTRS